MHKVFLYFMIFADIQFEHQHFKYNTNSLNSRVLQTSNTRKQTFMRNVWTQKNNPYAGIFIVSNSIDIKGIV